MTFGWSNRFNFQLCFTISVILIACTAYPSPNKESARPAPASSSSASGGKLSEQLGLKPKPAGDGDLVAAADQSTRLDGDDGGFDLEQVEKGYDQADEPRAGTPVHYEQEEEEEAPAGNYEEEGNGHNTERRERSDHGGGRQRRQHRGGYDEHGQDIGYGEGYGYGGHETYCEGCRHCNGCGHAPPQLYY